MPEINTDIDSIDSLIKDLYNPANTLLYDNISDTTLIYGKYYSSLIEYMKGKLHFKKVSLDLSSQIIHERQHYIDLNHTVYGIRQVLLFNKYMESFSNCFSSNKYPNRDVVIDFLVNIQTEFLGQKTQIKIHNINFNPMKMIGMSVRPSLKWSVENEPTVKSISVKFENKIDESLLGTVELSEKSIAEFSALGVEFLWKRSATNGASSIEDYEEQFFMQMHDFSKPDYLAAFHAAHASFQDSDNFSLSDGKNFSLAKTMMFGSMAARLSLFIVGTEAAKAIRWHEHFTIFHEENKRNIIEVLYDRLDCVFYNILLLSKELDFNVKESEWIASLLGIVGINSVSDIIANNINSLIYISDSLTGEDEYLRSRIVERCNFLAISNKNVKNIEKYGFLTFFPDLHPVNWANAFTNNGEPIFAAMNDTDMEAHLRRTLHVLLMRHASRDIMNFKF